ncbi:MAG: tRNA (guanosine(46)-N7)-methyltransferase TrmB [Pseudomonadota bacterium]|jgi:tRNA (guanine-N(7)-)-methyltransferase|nr:MAG: tRNA (guanosine(46)-N7)-methyltransferase TrmB [Pseudomonadota bacterium]
MTAAERSDSERPRRTVRSFVLRQGRMTDAQRRALEELWPRYGLEYSAEVLDLDRVFGRSAARTVEIGFGNGDNLIALAHANPGRDYLGIEVHRPGVGRALLAAQAHGLANLRVICHDAVEVFEYQLAPESIDEILVLFPDPWPKKRHQKRRLIQTPFVELMASRLRPGGVLRIATDWENYAQSILETLNACPRLQNLSPDGTFVPRPAERVPTRFEKRGERLGHRVWDLAFRRI